MAQVLHTNGFSLNLESFRIENFNVKLLISQNNKLFRIHTVITRRQKLSFGLSGSSTFQNLILTIQKILKNKTNNYFYIIINQVNTLIDQYNPTGLVLKHLHRFIDAAALQPPILLLTSWYPLLPIRILLLILK